MNSAILELTNGKFKMVNIFKSDLIKKCKMSVFTFEELSMKGMVMSNYRFFKMDLRTREHMYKFYYFIKDMVSGHIMVLRFKYFTYN